MGRILLILAKLNAFLLVAVYHRGWGRAKAWSSGLLCVALASGGVRCRIGKVAVMGRVKVLFLVTEDWYFCSHRLPVARAARDAGFEVVVAAREQAHAGRIRAEGFDFRPLRLSRRSLSPCRELGSLIEIARLYREVRPDIVHHVALKPVVYGSLAARWVGVPVVLNAMAGLGSMFVGEGIKKRAARAVILRAMRWVQPSRGCRMVFQNENDRALFVRGGATPAKPTVIIRGSGVDLEAFQAAAEPAGVPVVILPARMLWDKGVGEFVEAARLLRSSKTAVRCVLVGPEDPENPAAIPSRQLAVWKQEGAVEWWGARSDMPAVLAAASVVCLPSYREGLPKALLEGASAGRPLIATDVPGCSEIVRHGETGLLVPVRDARALAAAIETLLSNKGERARMGGNARRVAAEEFSESEVARRTLALYYELLCEAGLE